MIHHEPAASPSPMPWPRHQGSDTFRESAESLQLDEGADLPLPLEAEEAESSSAKEFHGKRAPPRIAFLIPVLIIPFSILGLLIRLGLSWIETFPGQQVFALAWPQFIGCILMGLFVSTRAWIEQGFSRVTCSKHGRWIGSFLYVALSSGLCGSITTFSSWSLGMFLELINPAKENHHPLQNILSALSELAVTLALSITGLQLGTHLGQAIIPPRPAVISSATASIIPVGSNTPATSAQNTTEPGTMGNTKPTQSTSTNLTVALPPLHWTTLDLTLISLGISLWIGMIIAAIFMPKGSQSSWRHVVLASCFAPLGAIIRWYLSRFNSKVKDFPIGTFAVNIGGTLLLAAIVCLQHAPGAGGSSALACQMLSGLQDGFCGCLTTISTFALELKTLRRKASYIYGTTSVVVAQLGMLLVLGSFVWTRRSTAMDDNVYQHSMCTM